MVLWDVTVLTAMNWFCLSYSIHSTSVNPSCRWHFKVVVDVIRVKLMSLVTRTYLAGSLILYDSDSFILSILLKRWMCFAYVPRSHSFKPVLFAYKIFAAGSTWLIHHVEIWKSKSKATRCFLRQLLTNGDMVFLHMYMVMNHSGKSRNKWQLPFMCFSLLYSKPM